VFRVLAALKQAYNHEWSKCQSFHFVARFPHFRVNLNYRFSHRCSSPSCNAKEHLDKVTHARCPSSHPTNSVRVRNVLVTFTQKIASWSDAFLGHHRTSVGIVIVPFTLHLRRQCSIVRNLSNDVILGVGMNFLSSFQSVHTPVAVFCC